MPNNENLSALLVIGNEILSGRTQDANVSFIGQRLVKRGIPLGEVCVVRDEQEAIIGAVNELRKKYKYLFTTGGIGPTHDDITTECVAQAFGAALILNPEAKRRLEDYYAKSQTALNEARLRMAHIPSGATLIDNPVSAAPGFKLGNVFVLAGVPQIMQAMFDHVETMLEGGTPVLSNTIRCDQREGDIAKELGNVQKEFPDVEIGSYPHMGLKGRSLSLVLRGIDEKRLNAATEKVMNIIRARGEEPRAMALRG